MLIGKAAPRGWRCAGSQYSSGALLRVLSSQANTPSTVTKPGTTPLILGTNPVKLCLELLFMDLSFDMSLSHPDVPLSWSVSAFFSLSIITSLENDR